MASVSGEGGIKRPREEEGERPEKRAKTSGILASVHEFVAISEKEFSGKSISSVAHVIKNLYAELVSGNFSSSPKELIKKLKRDVQVIQERLELRSDTPQEVMSDIQAILQLIKKPKATHSKALAETMSGLSPDITAFIHPTSAFIHSLWIQQDIKITAEYELLYFSDRIAPFVDDAFLKSVFANSGHVDFSKVTHFEFTRYVKLGPQSPELIYAHCPKVFDVGSILFTSTYLTSPQFCDHTLRIGEDEIDINRWFAASRSNFLKTLWEDFGVPESGITPVDIDAEIAIVLDCFEGMEPIDPQLSQLRDYLYVATKLDIPAAVQLYDKALADVVEWPPWPSDEAAITYITHVLNEFKGYLDAIPMTRKELNTLASQVFDNRCRDEAEEMGFRFRTTSGFSNEELALHFAVVAKVFERLGNTSILQDFSLLRLYPLDMMFKAGVRDNALRIQFQKLLETCLQYNPADEEALRILGYCHQWGVDPDKFVNAKKALEALKVRGADAQATCALAELVFKGANGVPADPERAIAMLETAIESKLASYELYITLAYLLREQGKKQKALDLLNRFDDKALNYKELGLNHDDVIRIRLYGYYQKALDGAQFTRTDYENLFGTAIWPGSPASFGITLGIVFQRFPVPERIRAWFEQLPGTNKFDDRIQEEQFLSTYPLFKDAINHCPQPIKDALFSIPAFTYLWQL